MISDDDLRRASQKWEEARLKQFPEPGSGDELIRIAESIVDVAS